ncbi:MAG: SCO family protein [Solirubrobacteraceae bacterium]
MSRRLRLFLAVLVLCAAGSVGIVFAVARDGRSAGAAAPAGFAGALRPPGLPLADFHLRDQDGRTANPREYRGRPVIVTFLYTTCRDTCPLTAQQIAGAMDLLGHSVPALAVSVDPKGDTPALAKKFLVKQRIDGRMRFLLGRATELQPVWREFGVAPQRPEAEHSVAVVVLDAEGRQRFGFGSDDLTPDGLARDVRALERAAPAARG